MFYRGPIKHDNNIAIVAIDEKSLSELGRWPWSREVIARLVMGLKEYGVKTVGFDIVFSEPEGEADRLLAQAIAQTNNVTLGYFFHTTTRDIGHLSAQEIARGKELIGNSQYPIVQVLSPPPEGLFFHAYAAVPCQEIIAQEAVNSGYFNAFPDTDGVIRRAPLVVKFDDEYYFPLSIAILLQYFDSPPIKLKLSEIGVEEITIENSRIPVDESGRFD